jgi:hypothetical protein
VPSTTLKSRFALIRGMSCDGGSSTKSSWPESSAAVRVASDWIGR